jgi:hypothetical protein
VPAAVPSLFHRSRPSPPPVAEKNREFPTAVRYLGLEVSATRTVPATVPSLFHSVVPLLGSVAEKKRVFPTAVRF